MSAKLVWFALAALSLILFQNFSPSDSAPVCTVFQAPITISHGGEYTGCWKSDDPAIPAIRILKTQEPVVIKNSVILSAGNAIEARMGGAHVAIRNVLARALNPNSENKINGAFLIADNPNQVELINNTMVNFGGYGIWINGLNGRSGKVSILRNSIQNSNSLLSDGFGGYKKQGKDTPHSIILSNISDHDGAIEIAWNQIINDPDSSYVNDTINLYRVRGTSENPISAHDNLIDGIYAANPTLENREYNSGCGIISDGAAVSSSTENAFIDIYNNIILNVSNVGIQVVAGHNINIYNNVIFSSGYLPSGRAIWGMNVGLSVYKLSYSSATFQQITINQNTIGFLRPKGSLYNSTPKDVTKSFWSNVIPDISAANTVLKINQMTPDFADSKKAEWADKLMAKNESVGAQINIEAENQFETILSGSTPVKKVKDVNASGDFAVSLGSLGGTISIPLAIADDQAFVRFRIRVRSGYFSDLKSDPTYYFRRNGYKLQLDNEPLTLIGGKTVNPLRDPFFGGIYWGTMYSQPVKVSKGTHRIVIQGTLSWGVVDQVYVNFMK